MYYFLNFILYFQWIFSLVKSRNQILQFAELADITGHSAVLGDSFQLGINDSFTESNANHELIGITLVQHVRDTESTESRAEEALATFINDIDNIFAFIGPTTLGVTRLIANYTIPNKIPLIGPLTGATEFRTPFNPYVINLRPSTDDESIAIVNYIVEKLLFTRIAVFYCSDEYGNSGINALQHAMYLRAITPYMMGIYDSENPSNITDAIAAKHLLPHIIIIRHYPNEVANLILFIKQSYPTMKFFVFSSTPLRYVAGVVYDNGGEDKRYIDGIYGTVGIARTLPSDIKYGTQSLSYRVAPGPIVAYSMNAIAGAIKLEGYLVGRLIIDTLKRLPSTVNITREAFINKIYDSGGYDLGPGFKCGAFLWPNAEIGADQNGCNQCSRQVKILYTHVSTMSILEDVEGTAKFSTCGFQKGNRNFLLFGMTKPMNGPYVYQSLQIDAGIRAAFNELNLADGLRGRKFIYESFEHRDYEEGRRNMDYLMNTLKVQSLIGLSDREFITYGLRNIKGDNPLLAGMSSSTIFREPFDFTYLNFLPSDKHQYMSLITYLFNTYGKMRIGLFTSNTEFGTATYRSLVDALHTRRLTLYTYGKYNSSLGNIQNTISHMRIEAQSGDPNAIIVDGSPNIVGQFIALGKRIWKRCLFIISSDGGTEDAIQAYTLISSNLTQVPLSIRYDRIYTLQSLPHPFNISMRPVSNYQKALRALDEGLTPSFYSLYGYLAVQMTAYLLNNDMKRNMHDIDFYRTTYQQSRFQLANFPCGPFINKSDISPGCSSCYQTTYLYRVLPTGSIDSTPVYSRNHDTCTPTLNSNISYTTIGHLFFIIVGGLFCLVTVILMLLLIRYRRHFLIIPNFKFSLLSCIGCFFYFINLCLEYGVPSQAQCITDIAMSNLAFVFTFGPLFSKTSRLYQIFNNRKLRKLRISDQTVLGRFLIMFVYFLIYNIAWGIIDPPTIKEAWIETRERYESCECKTTIFTTIDVLSHFTCYFYGVFLCFRIRGIKGEWAMFNESKEIGMAIYVGAFFRLLEFLLDCTLKNTYETAIADAIFETLSAITFLCILIIPSIYKAYHGVTREELIAAYKIGEEKLSFSNTLGETMEVIKRDSVGGRNSVGTAVQRRSTLRVSTVTVRQRNSIVVRANENDGENQ